MRLKTPFKRSWPALTATQSCKKLSVRILFLTNFYPPYQVGGQEQSCQQVVEGLKQRGHATLVLTSMYGTNNTPKEVGGISRSLYLEMDLVPWRHSLTFFTQRKRREKHNLQELERVLEAFAPDIVFIWGMWNLPRSLPAHAEAKCPGKVVYRFAEYWPTLPSQHELYWRAPGRTWYSRLVKRALRHIALAQLRKGNGQQTTLQLAQAMCVSAATRTILVEAGIPVTNARIVHTGLDVNQFPNGGRHPSGAEDHTLRLLYAGRLTADKGVDTVITAMAHLVSDRRLRCISLAIAGSGSTDYQNYLRLMVTQAGMTDYVSFLGPVPYAEMPRLLQKFDVLLVPSIWPEPFARVILEGMISGLAVVATPTGGTGEIIVDDDNGLLFMPGNAEDLARKIMRLVVDPGLRQRLAQAGQQTVRQRFTMPKMLAEIESYLQEVAWLSTNR
jgi:glycosyltransferase involved in cell wall biosynthesis